MGHEPVNSAVRLGDRTQRPETPKERLRDLGACQGSVVDGLAGAAPVATGAVVYLRDEVSIWNRFSN